MAVTKFTAIYINKVGKIIEREIPGMNTYKIAEKFAIMLNDPEETKLVCVVESWKSYPNKNDIDGKANISHTHDISNVTNLQPTLNSKLDKGTYAGNAQDLKT